MSSEGEFERRIGSKTVKVRVDSEISESFVIRTEELREILRIASADFPKKEAAVVMGSDGEEHSYETYDTEEVERWFTHWFGK
jgi:hypothetical protein